MADIILKDCSMIQQPAHILVNDQDKTNRFTLSTFVLVCVCLGQVWNNVQCDTQQAISDATHAD